MLNPNKGLMNFVKTSAQYPKKKSKNFLDNFLVRNKETDVDENPSLQLANFAHLILFSTQAYKNLSPKPKDGGIL